MEDSGLDFSGITASQNLPEIDGCIPIFHMRLIDDTAKSQETGKREYQEVAYVRVLSPGNDKEIPDFRVLEKHKERWPTQWAAFIRNEEAPIEGTPLKVWPGISRVECKMLSDVKVQTVEQLVEIPDANLNKIGQGFLTLKHRAKAFLASQEGQAGFVVLEAKNRELQEQVETQGEQIAQLETRVSQLLSGQTAHAAPESPPALTPVSVPKAEAAPVERPLPPGPLNMQSNEPIKEEESDKE